MRGPQGLRHQAVAHDPQSARNHRTLANDLSRLNRFKEAKAESRKFVELAPDDPAAATIQKAIDACGAGGQRFSLPRTATGR